jgi:hypothetical protein
MMRVLHIIAFVCQVGIMILMAYESERLHDNYLFLGALGWFVAACYNLGRLNVRTE